MNTEAPTNAASARTPSVAVKVAIGMVSLFGLTLSALLFFYAASPWFDHLEIPFFGSRLRDSTSFCIPAAASLYVAISLLSRKHWAWWAALVVSLAILSLAICLLVSTFFPRDDFARSEGGFGFFIGLCLFVPSMLSSVLLALSAVGRQYRSLITN